MVKEVKEKYEYSSLNDFLINFWEAKDIFSEKSDKDPLKADQQALIEELDADSEIEAIKNILDEIDSDFIVTRDSADKIFIIELPSPDIKPLEYYMKPENFRRIRKEMGYTQKEFGTLMGFYSKRRAHTILEKEKARVKITEREAIILRYLVAYGPLDKDSEL